MVRQVRYPLGRTKQELPAGKLEYGEEPRPAANRELGEEVGLKPGELTDMGFIYVSPGFCKEKLYMYLARNCTEVPVHPDEDEFLEIEYLPFDELVERVVSGEIQDGKTVAATLKTKVLLGL